MNSGQKYFSVCAFALLSQTAFGQLSAPPLSSDLQKFAVLSAGALSCTSSVFVGDVGALGAFVPVSCTSTGAMPPANNQAAANAVTDFHAAYSSLKGKPCTATLPSTITGPLTLTPGVYCTAAALTGAGTLTLDAQGNPNAVWIFQIGAAFTGTNFNVVMANGGQACNVYWAPSAGVTMTTSALKGNVLAGGATGAITLTGGTLVGRALASVAVTTTDSLVGCGVPAAAAGGGSLSCKVKKHKHHAGNEDRDHDGDEDDDEDDHDHDHDREHEKQPIGSKKGK
jgi:hypothetical protein